MANTTKREWYFQEYSDDNGTTWERVTPSVWKAEDTPNASECGEQTLTRWKLAPEITECVDPDEAVVLPSSRYCISGSSNIEYRLNEKPNGTYTGPFFTDDSYCINEVYYITSCKNMFNYSENSVIMKTVDLTNFDWSNVETTEGMFANCYKLTTVTLPLKKTCYLTDVQQMFYMCSGLTTINNFDNLDFTYVTDATEMFAYSNITSFSTTSKPQYMRYFKGMFQNCTNLTTVDLSGWKNIIHRCSSENHIEFTYMFSGCTNLNTIYLDGLNFYNSGRAHMFDNCTSLRTIYMRGCAQNSISSIESALLSSGIRSQVTIITS